MDSQTVRQKHKEFLFPCVANYYQEPIVITESHGANVKDADGRDYLDLFGGILTLGDGLFQCIRVAHHNTLRSYIGGAALLNLRVHQSIE